MSVEHQSGPEIENLLAEHRTFPPDAAFVATANVTAALYEEAAADPIAFWDRAGRERVSWSKPYERRSTGTSRSRSGSAAASSTSPTTASTGTSRRASATRSRTTGSASPATRGRSPTRTSCARVARPPTRSSSSASEGRPGRDLHADDPGAADRDAGLRPDRRAAHGRLRRLLRGGAVGPHQRLRREGPDHRRRRLAARQEGRPQAPRGRGGRVDARRSSTSSSSSASATASHMVPGRDHWWHEHRRPPGRGLPAGAGGQRAHALPALHVGHDRQAEGDPAHDRPATSSARRSPTGPCSTSSPTTSTGAPRTSAG